MNRSLLVLLALLIATVVAGHVPNVHAAPAPSSAQSASQPGYWALWTEAASH